MTTTRLSKDSKVVSSAKDALDGILKFAHLINIELISSLIEHLNTSATIFREYWKQTNKV